LTDINLLQSVIAFTSCRCITFNQSCIWRHCTLQNWSLYSESRPEGHPTLLTNKRGSRTSKKTTGFCWTLFISRDAIFILIDTLRMILHWLAQTC